MGIYMALNDSSRIIYYLKKEVTYFIEMSLSGHSITFQVLNEPWTFEEINKSGWEFKPISNKEFNEYVLPIKGIIDYDLLNLEKKKLKKVKDFSTLVDR